MFTRRLKLFTLFGFTVRVDLSWLIIAVLVTWTLAAQQFPKDYPDLAARTYWTMGVVAALAFFGCIVLHELAHSLVARRFGLPMEGITLFVFGGVAEMTREPPTAKSEFAMAIAGPIASIAIAGACYGLAELGRQWGWPLPAVGVLEWLALINAVLVGFNLVPAFPLDGGRVLRSILWHFKGNLRWATRITSALGSGFGLFLILFGVFALIGGDFIGGMWLFLIGMFLRGAAAMSYQQLILRRALEGEPVSRFMATDVQSVPPDATVEEFVRDYVYRHHFKMFPVTEDGRLVGCVTTRRIKEIPRDQWPQRSVGEVAEPASEQNTIPHDADAMQALAVMRRNNASRLMVVEDSRLRGIFSLKDVMEFLSLKIELEE